ncbi:MAG: alanine racemase [Bacteroidales bacterium]|nr:alanine racemase [Bacteroidales bacterium]
MSVRNIASILRTAVKGDTDFEIKNLLFDSRRLNVANNTLFFAITTANNDGRKFIPYLYAQGVRAFVLQGDFDTTGFDDAAFIFVNNTIKALQEIAVAKRQECKAVPVVAITGSNGKTIVKDWIVQLIGGDRKLCYTPRSYNSQIGVPFSVWNISKDDDLAIFEAGISKPDEMEHLEQIIQPSFGILTNIGDAHQVNFPSVETKLKEKLKLFSHCQSLIFCKDIINSEVVKAVLPNVNLIAWSRNDDRCKSIAALLPFNDKASTENAINAYLFAQMAGINEGKLRQRAAKLHALEQRLNVKVATGNSIIIDDSYSADLVSLEIALDFLNQQKHGAERIVIISDIEQSGIDAKDMVSKISLMLTNKHIKKAYCIGRKFFAHKSEIKLDNEVFESTNNFIKRLNISDFANKAILIKGARSFEFETISRLLEDKTHETRLEINLSALSDNVRYYKSLLQPCVKMMSMVKASSYGCGGWEVASALQNGSNVDYLAVAFADEGADLRNNGISLPIMVMSPESRAIEKIIHHNLEPEIYSLPILKQMVSAAYKPINIHLKLDTGMHRLGLERQDIETAISIIKNSPYIQIKSVFSHLFGADNPDLDKYTLDQIALFEENSKIIVDNFDYKIMRHLANSAAIVRFPQAHYDMVRLGIGMYGIGCNQTSQANLRYVHKLRTTITQIRHIRKDDNVGYNHNFIAKQDMIIGVIPIGYADGLNRHLGNGNYEVRIGEDKAAIIGNVCMDMCMIDLSCVNANEGDEVVIFAEQYPVAAMCEALQTIPYEVFTSISPRVKRVYFSE